MCTCAVCSFCLEPCCPQCFPVLGVGPLACWSFLPCTLHVFSYEPWLALCLCRRLCLCRISVFHWGVPWQVMPGTGSLGHGCPRAQCRLREQLSAALPERLGARGEPGQSRLWRGGRRVSCGLPLLSQLATCALSHARSMRPWFGLRQHLLRPYTADSVSLTAVVGCRGQINPHIP